LYSNFNKETVSSGPNSTGTEVFINTAARITGLETYHFNDGSGVNPAPVNGMIGLKDMAGNWVVPPTQANGIPGQNIPGHNGANESSMANVNQVVQAGEYVVVDSEPSTWSYNSTSKNQGFAAVYGAPSFVSNVPFYKGFVVIRSPEQLDVVGVYTVKNVVSSVPNPPMDNKTKCSYTYAVSVALAKPNWLPASRQSVPNYKINTDAMTIIATMTGGVAPYTASLTVSAANPDLGSFSPALGPNPGSPSNQLIWSWNPVFVAFPSKTTTVAGKVVVLPAPVLGGPVR
jgi:hypothetical protein